MYTYQTHEPDAPGATKDMQRNVVAVLVPARHTCDCPLKPRIMTIEREVNLGNQVGCLFSTHRN